MSILNPSPKTPEGIVLLDKPAGYTSFQMISRLRKCLGVKRIGHSGTLDPFATGLLVVAVGRACSVLQYLEGADKVYQFRTRLGRSTSTADPEGETVDLASLPVDWETQVDAEQLSRLAQQFTGSLKQSPPVYSAIKVQGKPLYRYAREGLEIPEVKERNVHIWELCLKQAYWDEADPQAPLCLDGEVHCSKGTYVRTLALDMGRALNLPAYCDRLRRTRAGCYKLENALSFELIEKALETGDASAVLAALLPKETALEHFPVLKLSATDLDALFCGRWLRKDGLSTDACYQAVWEDDQQETETCWGLVRVEDTESGRFLLVERMFYSREEFKQQVF